MAKKQSTKKKSTKKKSAKKKSAKKKSSKKKSSKKKSTKKKSTGQEAGGKAMDPLEQAKVELRDSVKNAVKAFAHVANAAEREAIDGLMSVTPDRMKTREKLADRKKRLEKGGTESIASDILAQIRGAPKSHNIDLGGGAGGSSKTPKSGKKKQG